MNNSTTYKAIKELYPSLSKGYKKIADYIIANTNKVPYMTAANIALECGVSESSVVRFANKCGFKGFPELKDSLFEEIYEDKNTHEQFNVSDIIANDIMNSEIENIIETYKNLDYNMISTAVNMLKKARRVYVLGVRESAIVAKHLAYYLNYILEDVRLVEASSSNNIIDSIYKMTNKDVLIGISFPNYSYNVLKGMEYANLKSANIISITDDKNSPMIMYSSCNIFARTKLDSVAESLAAPMSICNLLINKLCSELKDKVIDNLDVVNEALTEYQLEGNDDINMISDIIE